jgi:glycosyltransferase involved in cell wall biosynthesis
MKRILVLTEWFFPAYKADALITPCSNIITELSPQHCFYVLTSDREMGDTTPLNGVVTNEWTNLINKSVIRYVPKKNMTAAALRQIIKKINPHVIYINTVLSWRYSIMPLYVLEKIGFTGKIIIASGGLLHQNHFRFNTLKKKCISYLCSRVRLQWNVLFLATNEQEVALTKRYIGDNTSISMVEKIPNIDHSPFRKKDKERNHIKCVYISPLQDAPGLQYALEILKEVGRDIPVTFDVFAPAADKKFAGACLETASHLPANIKVKFYHPLPSFKHPEILNEYHLLFSPAPAESSSQIVLEALSAGCPVLTGGETSWRDIASHNAGWALCSSDKKLFAEKIKKIAGMHAEELGEMVINAKEYAYTRYRQFNFSQQYEELFFPGLQDKKQERKSMKGSGKSSSTAHPVHI